MNAAWQTEAQCRNQPGEFHGNRSRNAAKQCAQCPCNEICFWTAMVNEEEHASADTCTKPMRYGVWGGTTPAERARLAALYGQPTGARMRLFRGRLDRALREGPTPRMLRKAAGS